MFEGFGNKNPTDNTYEIKNKSWDYQIGYIWSTQRRNEYKYGSDFPVNKLPSQEEYSTYSTIGLGLGKQIKEYFGTDNSNLCITNPFHYGKNKEFDFSRYVTDNKIFVVIKEYGYNKTFEVDYLEDDYRMTIRRLLNRNISDKDMEGGKIGSWHLTTKYYNINGTKAMSFSFGSGQDEYLVAEKTGISDIVSGTRTFQYYKYVDKDEGGSRGSGQFFRLNKENVWFYDISDLFVDLQDEGFEIKDCYPTSKISFQVDMSPTNTKSLDSYTINSLKDGIKKAEKKYGVKLSSIKVSGHFGTWEATIDKLEGNELKSRDKIVLNFVR
jgi:hypothetical protein